MDILEKAQKDGAKIYLQTSINIGFSGARDLKAFTSEIDQNEKILCIITGKLVQVSNDRHRGMNRSQATGTDTKGVLVITEQKAVFMDKRVFGKQTTIIDGADISTVTSSNGIMSGRLEIVTFGSRYDISDLKKDAAADAVAALNQCKKNAKSQGQGQTITHAASGMDEIKKAKALFDEGIISKEEFDQIKAKHL